MSIMADEIDDSDRIRNEKLIERDNRLAEQRKLENKRIKENYPRFLYYKCGTCKQYLPYTSFRPILNKDGSYYDVVNRDTKEVLLDTYGNKVYNIKPEACNICYNKKKDIIFKNQAHYKTIFDKCKIDCPCGKKIQTGFSSNTTEIGQSYIDKHMNSKHHQNYIKLLESKPDDLEILFYKLSKTQLIEICKVNNIYGMTIKKKADIISEILKYQNIKL